MIAHGAVANLLYLPLLLNSTVALILRYDTRGGARNFPTGGLTLPTMGLKYGFQSTINAKNLRKIAFHFPTGG